MPHLTHWIYRLLAAAWMAFIWFLSSQTSLPGIALFPGEDKIAHFSAFGLLAYLLARAQSPWHGRLATPTAVAIACAATGFGLVDEIHQSFVPGRIPSLADLAADGAGAAVVIFMLWRPRSAGD